MKNIIAFAFLACAFFAAAPAFAQSAAAVEETRISTLEDQMRSLQGSIEQVEYEVKQLDQALQRMQTDTDARLSKLEQQAAAAQQQAAQQSQQQGPSQDQESAASGPTEASGTLGAIQTTQNGRVTGATLSPKSTPLPTTPPGYGLTPEEQYEQAFDILRKADYPGAEKAFKSFIDKNPKDKLVENAKYWYGETLYVQNKFAAAAGAFADAYQQDSKGAKAPDSLLKLGLSLSALNKTRDACTALEQLKVKFPKASPNIRSRADQERAKLKCGKS